MAGGSLPLNPKNGIAKFSDNNAYQLQSIKDIFDGFQDDCEDFLRKFVEKKDITFNCFKQIWVERSMWELFEMEQFKVLHKYSTYLFNIINKFINFSDSNYIKVGALYLMYTIHRLKYFGSDAKIRLTTDQYLILKSLINKLMGYGIHDVGFAFNYLRLTGAFQVVAESRVFGLENKYILSSYSIKEDIFKMKTTMDAIPFNIFSFDEEFNLKNLEKINQEYEEWLEKFSLSPQCQGTPMMEKSTVVDTMKKQLETMKEILAVKNENNDSDKSEEDEDNGKHTSEKYTMNPINYSLLNQNLLNMKREENQ